MIAVHTYYQGLINRVWVSGDNRHGLLLDLEADGRPVLASDTTFRCALHTGFTAMGVVGYATQFMERYDAAAPEVGFEQPGFDDADWQAAVVNRHADYQLVAQPSHQLVFEAIKPVVCRCDGNRWFVDFGAIYVGALRFAATGRAGDEIGLRFGQECDADGSVRYKLRANCTYAEAFALSGRRDTLVQYDYKAFRYAELVLPEGADIAVEPESIVLVARHYPFELKASCRFDDPTITAIWDLCVDSLRYGVQEVIMDCMEREKGYYLGDGCYTILTYCLLTKDVHLMEKFFDDFLRTRFINRGLVTCANCAFMQEIAEYPLIFCLLLLQYCHITGNLDFVRPRFAAFADILDYYRESYAQESGLLANLDKWCVVEWPHPMRDDYDVDLTEGRICSATHNVVNAYYLGAVKCLNEVAALLGRPAYADIRPLNDAFVGAFYDSERHLFKDRVGSDHISFHANVHAYCFGLFPEEAFRPAFLAMVREKRFTCSNFFATFPLFCGLLRDGEDALFYALLTDPQSWRRMLAEGATRTFEGWGRDTKWNTSLFHLTLTYAAAFLCDWDVKGMMAFSRR